MRPLTRRLISVAVYLACALPGIALGLDAAGDHLGANPIEELTHRTGFWGLTLLTATLAVTPVRRLTGWNGLVRYRRRIGVFAFTYLTLHFLTYIVLDQVLALDYVIEDIVERPYITVGFTSWLLLIPLAVTSTNGMIRRLGKRWQSLHRLIYIAGAGGVLHFLWLVKADLRRPLIFVTLFVTLLALRLVAPARVKAWRVSARRLVGRRRARTNLEEL